MAKPAQINTDYDGDVAQSLEDLEEAMASVEGAMEMLRGHRAFDEWFSALDDLYDEMVPARDELERHACAAETERVAELTRDYYRSVL